MFKYLCDSMRLNTIVMVKGHTGQVTCMQKEDGSGKCFNVTMLCNGKSVTFFMRITD